MHLRLHAPLAASVIHWQAPHPAITVVVSATFELTDEPTLERHPIPLDREVAGPVAPERWRVSEEVPWKKSPEVLLVGHACGATPSDVLPVRLAVGTVDKRCVAVAGAPSEHIPLSSAFLRTAEHGGEITRTAPTTPRVPGWDRRRLPAETDFEAFNCAPRDQRLRVLEPGMPIRLEGTLMGLGQCETRIPRFRPAAFLADPESPPDAWRALALTCDTLWLDADAGVGTVVWRGVCPAPPPSTELVLGGAEGPTTAAEIASNPEVQAQPTPRTATQDRAASTVRGGTMAAPLDTGEARYDGTPLLVFEAPPPRIDIADEETFGIDETTMRSKAVSPEVVAKLVRVPVEEARLDDTAPVPVFRFADEDTAHDDTAPAPALRFDRAADTVEDPEPPIPSSPASSPPTTVRADYRDDD